jgi:ribose/xylose/arabinose/galactoside ABC-type transport system permease subunit
MEEFISQMDPLALALVSIFLPALQSAVQPETLPVRWKALAGIAIPFAAGAAVGYFTGIDTRDGYLTSMVATYMLSQMTYLGVYSPTGADAAIENSVGFQDVKGDN